MSLLSSTISTTNIWKDQIIPKLNKTRNFSRNYQGTCLEMKGKKISLCPILIEVNRNRIKAFFPLYTSVHIAKILNRVGLNVLFAVSELLSLTNRLWEKFYLCYKITLIYPLFLELEIVLLLPLMLHYEFVFFFSFNPKFPNISVDWAVVAILYLFFSITQK